MRLKARVWKFGDNINTDLIIPARYLNTFDAKELGAHCMEDADQYFPKKVRKGDVIVAGKDFGCGSSREHAPISIKGCGVSCVIAESFARIFFRNSINIGLPILESKLASHDIKEGDEIEVDFCKGIIYNLTQKTKYQSNPFPKFMEEIVKAGGLLDWVNKNQKNKKSNKK